MDKQYRIIFSDQIYKDLLDIPSKISNEILDTIQHLEVFPEMGIKIQSKFWSGHQIFIKNYRVLYKIIDDKKLIRVYHIRHGKRYFK